MASDRLDSCPTCTVSNQETGNNAQPKMLAQTRIYDLSYGTCTGAVAMASAKRYSYPVSNQESDRTANGAQPRLMVQTRI